MTANGNAIGDLELNIDRLKTEIANAREQLVVVEGSLKDEQLYMKDLTERCEVGATDWDQRSKMRSDELEALRQATAILEDDVKGKDTQVNKRALLVERHEFVGRAGQAHLASAPNTVKLAAVSAHSAGPSFVQEAIIQKHGLRGAHAAAASMHVRQANAVVWLRSEGQRLKSSVLSLL